MLTALNFEFLKGQDARLTQLGSLAESYFRQDPITAIMKLRQFAELLAKLVAARSGVYLGERESFEDTLRRLAFERFLPPEAANVFHAVRKLSNIAVHEARGSHSDALTALKLSRQLGIWFYRAHARQPDFSPGPFVPPPEPVDATIALRSEIADPLRDGHLRPYARSRSALVAPRRRGFASPPSGFVRIPPHAP